MICIITGNKKLATELALSLNNSGVQCRIVDVNSEELLTVLYESTISGAIVDSLIPNVPANAWLDVLGALGRRIPVIVLESDLGSSIQFGSSSRNSELLTSIQDVNVAEIVGLLRATGVVETRAGQAMLA
ncbi:MAG: hypothetical protein NT027_12940, partial [Proteobacteria bacterium]|nr:hypothetical protein [Pseudomonadota bacterium]